MLFKVLKTGFGVLEEAIPAPKAGCKINNGATTVVIPMIMAGANDGERAQSNPYTETNTAAKVIPME